MANNIIIAEVPSPSWELKHTLDLKIDRSRTTVRDFLEEQGITWVTADTSDADVRIVKEMVSSSVSFRPALSHLRKLLRAQPTVTLLSEPVELARLSYRLAKPESTLAIAPGKLFERLMFASEWIDPQLDGWAGRLDSICWIARPTPERVAWAAALQERGLPLHIYSRQPWPLNCWKGYAENELHTARKYKYRIVFENSERDGYHSEKLLYGVRSGCVSLYRSGVIEDLPHINRVSLPLSLENLVQRDDLAPRILAGIEDFMYSDAWEIYSLKAFYSRLIAKIKTVLTKF